MSAAVVCCRKDCEKLSTSKSFKAIHNAFMSSQNKFRFIVFKELLDSVWTKFDNVSCSIRIAYKIWLNSQFCITICWIRPKNIDNKLLFWRGNFVDYLKWPFNCFYLFQTQQSASYSTMNANNSLIDYCCKWQPVKKFINFTEN